MTVKVLGKRVVVAGLISAKAPVDDFETLCERLSDAGGEVVGRLLQRRGVSRSKRPGGAQRMDLPLSSATIISKGKVGELAQLCEASEAQLVVFLNPLTQKQLGNLEQATGCGVINWDAPSS
jgi:50S ribosomal subunit-associated GTPase HflX